MFGAAYNGTCAKSVRTEALPLGGPSQFAALLAAKSLRRVRGRRSDGQELPGNVCGAGTHPTVCGVPKIWRCPMAPTHRYVVEWLFAMRWTSVCTRTRPNMHVQWVVGTTCLGGDRIRKASIQATSCTLTDNAWRTTWSKQSGEGSDAIFPPRILLTCWPIRATTTPRWRWTRPSDRQDSDVPRTTLGAPDSWLHASGFQASIPRSRRPPDAPRGLTCHCVIQLRLVSMRTSSSACFLSRRPRVDRASPC